MEYVLNNYNLKPYGSFYSVLDLCLILFKPKGYYKGSEYISWNNTFTAVEFPRYQKLSEPVFKPCTIYKVNRMHWSGRLVPRSTERVPAYRTTDNDVKGERSMALALLNSPQVSLFLFFSKFAYYVNVIIVLVNFSSSSLKFGTKYSWDN